MFYDPKAVKSFIRFSVGYVGCERPCLRLQYNKYSVMAFSCLYKHHHYKERNKRPNPLWDIKMSHSSGNFNLASIFSLATLVYECFQKQNRSDEITSLVICWIS